MKKLFIIRHGKSDWKQGVIDFERPLNPRGKKDAPNMGKFLHKHHETPDTVISSTANRAISTARLLLHEMDFSLTEISESDHLYHASVQTLLNEISKFSSKTNVAYVFGHNPGLSDLVSYLSGEPTMLKTCCVALLELQVDNWDELSQDTCLLLKYLSPKQI